jgi:hypothetical protein
MGRHASEHNAYMFSETDPAQFRQETIGDEDPFQHGPQYPEATADCEHNDQCGDTIFDPLGGSPALVAFLPSLTLLFALRLRPEELAVTHRGQDPVGPARGFRMI